MSVTLVIDSREAVTNMWHCKQCMMWTFYSFVSCLLSSDFYRGPVIEKVRLQGLEHVLQFTAVDGKIYLRSYRYKKIFKQLHILSCVWDIYWCFSGDNVNNILWKSNSRCENGFVVTETDFINICTETDRYNFVLVLMILVDLLDWWDCWNIYYAVTFL